MLSHIYSGLIAWLMKLILMLAVMILPILFGCHRNVDSRLIAVDSMMEEHPDSALMAIDEYKLSDNASDYDRALYGLLLTHARYKNFIDETNDSLINASAEYFLDHGDKEYASRSLFLKGMINMNANNLGEAAVAFTQGLDLAHEEKLYMWEGQCARGLFNLYSNLCDGSSQLKYAKIAYDSFLKRGYKDWINYSKLELACAYNNSLQYDKAFKIADELEMEAVEIKNTLILSESLIVKGVALFALRKYEESIENYSRACKLNPFILTDESKRNVRNAIQERYGEMLPESIKWIADKAQIVDVADDSFNLLASQGRYEDAFESLERYKNKQDSVISQICKNNVAESVSSYEKMIGALAQERLNNERLIYGFLILIVVVVGFVGYWISREKMYKERAVRLKAESDLESLRSDFMSQLKSTQLVDEILEYKSNNIEGDFMSIIRQKYAEANELCDDYYQGRFSKNGKDGLEVKIKNIVKGFTDRDSLSKIEEYVNETSDSLYSTFKNDFFDITEDNRRLFLYLMLGFSSRTISVIFGQEISAVYNKKSRLKARIAKSKASNKEQYLKFF